MKLLTNIALILLAMITSFLVGRWSTASPDGPAELPHGVARAAGAHEASTPPAAPPNAAVKADPQQIRELAASGANLTKEQCLALTSEERLELVRKGALIFDGLKQEAFLRGVIPTFSKDELGQAIDLLGKAQNRGNLCAQGVWDEVWRQSGRVNAEGCLNSFSYGISRSDCRHVMEAWLETDLEGARAWAKTKKISQHQAAAAAYALTHEAGGDAAKLLSTLSSLQSDEAVQKECLKDYFDLAELTGQTQGTASIYDQLPPTLRPQAWETTMERLCYTNPQQAVEWLASHVNDPGRDYRPTIRLFRDLAQDDPVGTAAWAAKLPDAANGSIHPGQIVYSTWQHQDPDAAKAWIETLPPSAAWASRYR